MDKKSHVNVGTIGHVDHGKSKLAKAIFVALAMQYSPHLISKNKTCNNTKPSV